MLKCNKRLSSGTAKQLKTRYAIIIQLIQGFRVAKSTCHSFNSLPKNPPEVFCKERFSYKFCKIYRKTPVPESVFAGLRPLALLKKRLWHRCFPVNCAEFLRTHFTESLWATASTIAEICLKSTLFWNEKSFKYKTKQRKRVENI